MGDEFDEDLQLALQMSLQESLENNEEPTTPTPESTPTPTPTNEEGNPSNPPLPHIPPNLFSFDPQSLMGAWGAIEVEEHKMVLVVRVDLGMTKGKMCAQCGHATLGAYKQAMGTPDVRKWEESGEAKIALKVSSEEQLLGLAKQCETSGLNHCIVTDAGRTQIKPGITVLAVGPAPKSKIDAITGSLKLL